MPEFLACESARGSHALGACRAAFAGAAGLDGKPDRMKNKLILISLMLSLVALVSGCVVVLVGGAAAAGVGGYAYVNGEIKSTVSGSLDKAWDATQGAMQDLEFPVVNRSKEALQAELTARNASDTKISLKLRKLSESATEIRIRVGTFGDESLSRLILEKINHRLGAGH